MKNRTIVFQTAVTYIGTVIGAGFASGQEIIQFFTKLGYHGIWGILLATCLFGVWGMFFLCLATKCEAKSYTQLFEQFFGQRVAWIMDFFMTFFLFSGLAVMFAGCGAIFSEHLGLVYDLGIFISALLTVIIVIFGIAGLMWANSLIVPIMFCMTALTAIFTYYRHGCSFPEFSPMDHRWMKYAFLYVAYNMSLSIGVLLSLGQGIKKKQELYLGGLLGGLGLGCLLFLNHYSLLSYYPQSFSYQVPMLYIAGQYGRYFYFFYLLILWLEMISTAVANLYSLAKKIESVSRYRYEQIVCVSILLVIPFSYLGFSSLVTYLYPLLGYFSVILFLLLSCTFFRMGRK